MTNISKNLLIAAPSNAEFENLSNHAIRGTPMPQIAKQLRTSLATVRKKLVFYGLLPYWKEAAGKSRRQINANRRLDYLKTTLTWELYEKLTMQGLTTRISGVILFVEGIQVKVAGPRKRTWRDQTFYVIPYDHSGIRVYCIKTDSGKWIFYLPYVKRRHRRLLYLNETKENKPEVFPTRGELRVLKRVWSDRVKLDHLKKKGVFEKEGVYGRFRETDVPSAGRSESKRQWLWGKVKPS